LNLLNAKVALPLDKLEGALKAGKIVFTWKQICEWMQPPVNSVSGAQETSVELPLRIIAPLFMAKHRPKVQKKVSISEMPDLFTAQTKVESPKPQSVSTAPAPSAPIAFTAPVVPVAAPAPVASAPSISIKPVALPVEPKPAPAEPKPARAEPKPARAEPKLTVVPELKMVNPVAPPAEIKMPVAPKIKPSVLGEILGQPAKQDWTPNEIVKGLAGLPEIAGAFVAMQDGLLVAAQLPPHLTADTVAAFLPQIFGRMNQYTKELKLGGLTSLTFVVENVSWQIIKSGSVYLVALGKSGESLPGPKLNTIAAELGKQIQ
jgi:predicted regulator of Ras-like GTPase activity (Roadblock/LC7/MglB family)